MSCSECLTLEMHFSRGDDINLLAITPFDSLYRSIVDGTKEKCLSATDWIYLAGKFFAVVFLSYHFSKRNVAVVYTAACCLVSCFSAILQKA